MNHLLPYWAPAELLSNGLIILNILGAMVLGLALGYERSFHGHAAGMRTYALVCLASAALTAIAGYPGDWFGGINGPQGGVTADPTRVIQGIVTGIGFLGAGVIMKEGFTIRGLSTAASIWVTSAIGVIIGIGFYATAILATIVVLILMSGFKRLETSLPHHRQLRLTLTYARADCVPPEALHPLAKTLGYGILELWCQSDPEGKFFVYDLVLQGDGTHNFNHLVVALQQMADLRAFRLEPIRD